tara:strand:+ start:5553 stop:6257 length:705 start_codon:yes stop_codon:yes gene_type:complete
MIGDFLHLIEKHFFREYPREACGLLVVKKGKAEWVPCTNVAEDGKDFEIDSREYIKALKTSDIVGVVHNHPDSTNDPSPPDIANCNALGVPYYIFSYPGMDLKILQPEKNYTELYGREYSFGTQDCFEAMRDYLAKENISIPPRASFKEKWFEKDLDYFNPETVKLWNHKEVPVEDIQKNDVITFCIYSEVANHCGVYLGQDVFYHHARGRLSCRESLYPFWAQYIDRVYRYVA